MTTPTASPTPTIATLASNLASALKSTLVSVTNADATAAEQWAEQYAPQAVIWGTQLAAARAANDTDAIARLNEDFAELEALAVEEAADLAVQAQASGEQDLANVGPVLSGALKTIGFLAPLLA